MIQGALNTVLGHCDGAIERDGVGFNKPDAYLVRAVIAQPEAEWSPFKKFAMWHILRKYRHTQLPNYGIDFEAIPRPPVPQKLGLGATDNSENALLRVAIPDSYDPSDDFTGDAEAIAAFRAAWDEIKAERQALKDQEKAAREILKAEARERRAKEREGIDARLAEKNRRCVHWGTERAGVCTFQYPYDPSLYDLVKDGGAARWDGQGYRWFRDIDGGAARVAITLAEKHGFELDGTTEEALYGLLGIWETDEAKRREAAAKVEEERRRQAQFTTSPHAQGDNIIFRFPYNPTLSQQIKSMGGKWDGSNYYWYITVTERNVVETSASLVTLIENAGWFLLPEVDALLKRMIAQGAEERQSLQYMSALSRADDAELELPRTFKGKARNFQKAGALYALKARRTFIGDDRGLGKTVESLLAVEIAQAYPALVVCPASAKYNWRKEVLKWFDGKRVLVLSGKSGPIPDDTDVIVSNYDILDKNMDVLRALQPRLRAIIVDESHYCKNGKARRSQCVHELSRGVEYRLLLSGTVTKNRAREVIYQLEILDRLEDLGGEKHFKFRWCDPQFDGWGYTFDGVSNGDELNDKLREIAYVRREKTQVLKELPRKQRNTVWVDLSNREEYEEAEQSLFRFILEKAREQAKEKGELAGLTEAEQSELLMERVQEGMFKVTQAEKLVQMNALRQVCAKGKMEAIKEWVGDFLETDQKLVMFGWHRTTVQGLARAFKTPTIMGGDSAQRRFEVVESFQTDPEVRAVSCNLVAASEAITLTAAADTVHVELGWNPGTHDQAEDRVLRIGQEAQAVNAWYLLAENTVDEELWNLIEDKRRGTDSVNIGRYAGGDVVQMGKKDEDAVDVNMLSVLMDRMTQRAIRAQLEAKRGK